MTAIKLIDNTLSTSVVEGKGNKTPYMGMSITPIFQTMVARPQRGPLVADSSKGPFWCGHQPVVLMTLAPFIEKKALSTAQSSDVQHETLAPNKASPDKPFIHQKEVGVVMRILAKIKALVEAFFGKKRIQDSAASQLVHKPSTQNAVKTAQDRPSTITAVEKLPRPEISEQPKVVGIRNMTGSACFANALFQNILANETLRKKILVHEEHGSDCPLTQFMDEYAKCTKTGKPCEFKERLQQRFIPESGSQEDPSQAFLHILEKYNPVEVVQEELVRFYSLKEHIEVEDYVKGLVEDCKANGEGQRREFEQIESPDESVNFSKTREAYEYSALFRKKCFDPVGTPIIKLNSGSSTLDGGPLQVLLANNSHRVGVFPVNQDGDIAVFRDVKSSQLEARGASPLDRCHSGMMESFTKPLDFLAVEIVRGGDKANPKMMDHKKWTLDSEMIQIPGDYFSQSEAVPYRMTGFIEHHGKYQTCGHYVAYVTRQQNGATLYYEVNDESVRPVSREDFLKAFSSSSLAFFEKQ